MALHSFHSFLFAFSIMCLFNRIGKIEGMKRNKAKIGNNKGIPDTIKVDLKGSYKMMKGAKCY